MERQPTSPPLMRPIGRTARWPSALLLAALLVPLAGGFARAQQGLPKEACDALRSERDQLSQAGVPQSMERGPEWAKANLTPDRLELIKRYIEVGEQILFRCEKLKPLPVRADPGEDGDKDGDKDEAQKPEPAQKPTPARPKPRPAAEGQPKAAGNAAKGAGQAAGQSSGSAAPAAKPKPKPAPKPNDAYVPPKGQPSGLGGLDAQAGFQPRPQP